VNLRNRRKTSRQAAKAQRKEELRNALFDLCSVATEIGEFCKDLSMGKPTALTTFPILSFLCAFAALREIFVIFDRV
jgi:hypothetical protein